MKILSRLQKLLHARPSVFGCDISDHSIRVALLKEEGDALTLSSFGTRSLPEGVIANGSITDMRRAAEGLRAAVSEVKGERMRTSFVVASLPDPQVFLRIVQLPKLNRGEVIEAIRWEIEANVPLALDELYYDWEETESTLQQDHLDILVAAAPRALVDSYETLFKQSGLKPLAFDFDVIAAARSVIPPSENTGVLLLIDFANDRTTFTVYAGGLVRFTASVPIAAKTLMPDSVKPVAKTVAGYVKQYIEFFLTHSVHAHLLSPNIRKVYVLGDAAANFPGLLSALAVETGLPVFLANPWVNILRPPLHEVPLLPYKDSIGYAVALGLALRGIHEPSLS